MQRPIILVYGRDLALLSTRRMVLESVGYGVIEAKNLSEVVNILATLPVQLLVLCHSLSETDCRELSDELDAGLGPKMLILTAGSLGRPAAALGEVLDTREGPARLISVEESSFAMNTPKKSLPMPCRCEELHRIGVVKLASKGRKPQQLAESTERRATSAKASEDSVLAPPVGTCSEKNPGVPNAAR